MKFKHFTSILCAALLSGTAALAQTSHQTDFSTIENWSDTSGFYTLTNPNGTLQAVTKAGNKWETFIYQFDPVDMSSNPLVQVDIMAQTAATVRIDLIDVAGHLTNISETKIVVPAGNTFKTYYYNFEGKFFQMYPPKDASTNPDTPFDIDSRAINRIAISIDPSSTPTSGSKTVTLDNLKMGTLVTLPPPPSGIRVNQIGYYPVGPKVGVLAQIKATNFYLVDVNGDTVYTGSVPAQVRYAAAGENVSRVDFTDFQQPGTYTLNADTFESAPFDIAERVHLSVSKGLIKGYYYNRASTAIVDPTWPRSYDPAQDPETTVDIHPSAVIPGMPVTQPFVSTKGWFDAGDYNKYVVNSGIPTYLMLGLYEHFPQYFDSLKTDIPESDNALPDILDEAIWQLDWLITTQAPDGSVYHKIAETNFPGMNVMPYNSTSASKRIYAISRSTSAACNFAAVLAQASRILSKPEWADQLPFPGYADSLLAKAKRAYAWAEANPDSLFLRNPEGVYTGPYDDSNASDELSWARTELFVTTKDASRYYRRGDIATSNNFPTPGYQNPRLLGLISLVNNRTQIAAALGGNIADTTTFKDKLKSLANGYRSTMSPYGVSHGLTAGDFYWGANTVPAHKGVVLLNAFRITGDFTYLHTAVASLDYLLGRNATGYSFVTGFGEKSPMFPHHRISNADNVAAPIPGMVVGGPNSSPDTRGESLNGAVYPSDAARSYLDVLPSHSTNEPAINYAAPVMYLANGLEAMMAYYGNTVLPIEKYEAMVAETVTLYPNPAKDEVSVKLESKGTFTVQVKDIRGVVLQEKKGTSGTERLSVENLEAGLYFISVTNDKGTVTKKFIKD